MSIFSIVVPVYNVEDYLDECVQSVINQSYTDWELILVDDGSPDNCPQLCDEYAFRDNRIKVIHKENGGASSARNLGVSMSRGEYVLFLDSDDFYNDDNALKIMNEGITDSSCDVLVFGCTDFNMNTGESVVTRGGYDLNLISVSSYNESLHYLMQNKMLPGGPTVFCTRRELIIQNSIIFKEGVQNEDYDYVLSVFMYAKSISALNNPFYSYRKARQDSVTGTASIKMIYGIEYTLNKWLNNLSLIDTEQIRKDYLNYLAFIYSTGFVACGRMNRDDRREALKIMKRHKDVLKYAYWKKPIITRYAIKIIGMNAFSVLAAKYFDRTHI